MPSDPVRVEHNNQLVSTVNPFPVTDANAALGVGLLADLVAALGTAVDVEAPGNGTVIAILKYLRTLLGIRADAAAADVSAPAADTAAVVTYNAVADAQHVISGIAWGYNAVPTGGSLTVEDGAGTTVFSMPITADGAGFIPFDPPKRGTINTALIITLAAGGASVTGTLSILGHWTE